MEYLVATPRCLLLRKVKPERVSIKVHHLREHNYKKKKRSKICSKASRQHAKGKYKMQRITI